MRPSILALLIFAFASTILRAQFGPVPEILYLRFEEGSGFTTADAAVPGVGSMPTILGNGNWTTVGAPVGQSALDTASAAGPGLAVCRTNAPFTTTGSWTLEVSIRRNSGQSPSLPSYTILTGSNFSLMGQHSMLTFLGSGFSVTLPGAAPIAGTVHLALVYNNQSATVSTYLNGTLSNVANAPFNTLSAGAGGIDIGPAVAPLMGPFGGYIDELRIWSQARSAAEIAASVGTHLGGLVEPVRSLDFADPLPSLAFTTTSGALSAPGIISAVTFADGSSIASPVVDAVVGAPLIVSGSYSGTDLAALSDVLFTPCSVRISPAPMNDELVVTSIFGAAFGSGDDWTFENPSSALPIRRRALGTASPSIVQRIGGGSAVLDAVRDSLFSGATPTLLVDLLQQGPRIRSLVFDYTPPPPTPEARLRPLGNGGVRIGLVDVAPFSAVHDVFALNSPIPAGTGTFFGLEFGAFQLNQLMLPFTSPPFTAVASSSGTYLFSLTAPVVPPGTFVDMVTITVPPGANFIGYVSAVQRVAF